VPATRTYILCILGLKQHLSRQCIHTNQIFLYR